MYEFYRQWWLFRRNLRHNDVETLAFQKSDVFLKKPVCFLNFAYRVELYLFGVDKATAGLRKSHRWSKDQVFSRHIFYLCTFRIRRNLCFFTFKTRFICWSVKPESFPQSFPNFSVHSNPSIGASQLSTKHDWVFTPSVESVLKFLILSWVL